MFMGVNLALYTCLTELATKAVDYTTVLAITYESHIMYSIMDTVCTVLTDVHVCIGHHVTA